ncbi:argonaute family member [Coprinopsis cinerea AmutBmut pab1-1]|nr:argonaute family member [Coprinopsis cinerea AmutBmut pab1-1]
MSTRGRSRARASGRGARSPISLPDTARATHIDTVGIRRPGFGTKGRATEIIVNCFLANVPSQIIHHYDVISPDEKKLPAAVNLKLITHLQTTIAPDVFTPRGVYDGRKNFFSSKELPFGGQKSMEFNVPFIDGPTAAPATSHRGPRICQVKLTKVAQINTEVLRRFTEGLQSADANVQTAITACNVVVRMQPILSHPFNTRSFFPGTERKDLGEGLEAWRGLFQSVRPSFDRIFVNVDISTGIMHKGGPLEEHLLAILRGRRRVEGKTGLRAKTLDPQCLRFLERSVNGIRVIVMIPGATPRERVLKGLTSKDSSAVFLMPDKTKISVAQYYQTVGNGSIVPLEFCVVKEGQFMRKQIPQEKIADVLKFSTNKPNDRLNKIREGRNALGHQSEYVQSFGLEIDDSPMKVQARVLAPPRLKYGKNSKRPGAEFETPQNGAWNMKDRKFYQGSAIGGRWGVVVFGDGRSRQGNVTEMIRSLVAACQATGIAIEPTKYWAEVPSQGSVVHDQLKRIGQRIYDGHNKVPPSLIVVVLPDGPVANEIYSQVKFFGDVKMGVHTQCMRAMRCFGGNNQYFANIALKLNARLGGVNVAPDLSDGVSRNLLSPPNKTLVMGADVIHPSPGSEGRPSFTAVVGSTDCNMTRFVSSTRAQTSREEIIDDLKDMSMEVLGQYKQTNKANPTSIIFYRDGVSEGQFQHVLEKEVAALKAACQSLGIPSAKITFIIVGKRHHIRFFPASQNDADRSGNCKAGTVVDGHITHPLEYDFYLQSHGGLLGTSRPAHYSVLYDARQPVESLTFTLCHLYARSTRSVSIPAPVYYADIVCSRSKNHFEPETRSGSASEYSGTNGGPARDVEEVKKNFKPLHQNMKNAMYFV